MTWDPLSSHSQAPSNLFTMMANPASAYSATQFSVPPMASQPQHPAPHPSPLSPASPTIHLHLEQGGASSRWDVSQHFRLQNIFRMRLNPHSSRQPIGHQALPTRALHNNNLPERPSPESSPSSLLHESRPLNAPASPGIKRRQPSDDGGISSGRFSPSFVSPTGSSKRSANKIGSSPPSTTNAAFALPQAPESPAYPRSSLADLGAFNSEGDDGDDESGKRRAKNRLAQRKFREKQRSQVAQMQAQLDAKDAQLTAKDAQLQTAVSLIRDLTNQLALYRATFGPLPPLPGSRGGGVGGPSAPQGSQPQPDVAQP